MDTGGSTIEPGAVLSRLRLLGLVFAGALVFRLLHVLVLYLLDPGTEPPLGGDFAAFWSAARLAVEGRAVEAFDSAAIYPLQFEAIGEEGVLLWHYPPTWTLVVTPFGWLDYMPALGLFLVLSLALWVLALRRLFPGLDWMLLSAVAVGPAFWVTLAQGQNGMLSGACLVLVAAGMVHGGWRWPVVGAAALLAKPHLGVAIPLAWIARGRWRNIAATAVLGLAFLGISTWAFGLEYWQAFLSNDGTLKGALEGGELWDQQVTVYSTLARFGLPHATALSIHAAVALGLLALAWQVFRAGIPGLSAAMLLMIGAALPPYAFHYDLCATMPALFLVLKDAGRAPLLRWELALIVALYMAPPFQKLLAEFTGISVTGPLLLAASWMIWRRARLA